MSKWLVLIIVLLGLSGCKDESGEAYTMSIQNGLDYLAAEDYNRAEVYFELALDARPDDLQASALLSQVQLFQKAVEYFVMDRYEESLDELNQLFNINDGSVAMRVKAEQLIEEINRAQNELYAEAELEEGTLTQDESVDLNMEEESTDAGVEDENTEDSKEMLTEENQDESNEDSGESVSHQEQVSEESSENTPSLEGYSVKEIEYARILLMTSQVDLSSPIIYVSQSPAGTPVAEGYEETVTFPAAVTVLSGEYGASGSIFYSSHGDGHITIYPMPSHWHQDDQSDEGYRKYSQEILDNAEKVYVDPGDTEEIINYIDRVTFDYYY